MGKIRVVVVDDSAFMRKLITDFLNEGSNIEVVGTAKNGKEALVKVAQLNPDVVTMDIEMPVMNGLEALKEIMKRSPRPVIMISSTTIEGAENTIRSLQYGAVDFIEKPSDGISLDLYKIKKDIQTKVILAEKANVKIERKHNPKIVEYSKIDSKEIYSPNNSIQKTIICIGTSTGGPKALHHVLPKLPSNLGAPLFIVQHMPPDFTRSLANRLNLVSAIRVKEAEDGELVENGTAYIAPGDSHLKVMEFGNYLTIKLDQSKNRNGHRPSVDVMFESISTIHTYNKIAIIMTGMGVDGTEGLKELKRTGNVKAIIESEETAVVYGMPKSALNTHLVDKVEHVEDIAASIMYFLQN